MTQPIYCFGKINPFLLKFIKVISRVVLSPFFKIRINGLENIPEKGSFILLPKHQRWEDIPILGISINRSLYYMAKQELFGNFFSKRFISSLGGIPLDRTKPTKSRKSLELMIELINRGEGVVIFPEGTYYKGRIGKVRKGLIRIILSHCNVCFIPVGIEYSKSSGRTLARIEIGSQVFGDSFDKDVVLLSDYLMSEIARFSGL